MFKWIVIINLNDNHQFYNWLMSWFFLKINLTTLEYWRTKIFSSICIRAESVLRREEFALGELNLNITHFQRLKVKNKKNRGFEIFIYDYHIDVSLMEVSQDHQNCEKTWAESVRDQICWACAKAKHDTADVQVKYKTF